MNLDFNVVVKNRHRNEVCPFFDVMKEFKLSAMDAAAISNDITLILAGTTIKKTTRKVSKK